MRIPLIIALSSCLGALALSGCGPSTVSPKRQAENYDVRPEGNEGQAAEPSLPLTGNNVDSGDVLAASQDDTVQASKTNDGETHIDDGPTNSDPLTESNATDADVVPQGADSLADTVAESSSSSTVSTPATGTDNEAVTRVLLLTDGGPSIVDVTLRVDGQSLAKAKQKLIRAVLDAGDTDNDGIVTWHEATRDPRLNNGQFGTDPIESEEQRRQLVFAHDINRNRRMDPDEVVGYLLRGVTGGSRLIRVQTNATASTPLFQWLDENRNQRLDPMECEAASERIALLDANGDGQVRFAELQGLMPQSDPQAASEKVLPLVHILREDLDWSRLLFAVEEYYAFGSPLQIDDWPERHDLYHSLDTDGDGSISEAEASELVQVAADVTIPISFETSTDDDASSANNGQLTTNAAPTGHFELATGELQVQLLTDPPQFNLGSAQIQRIWERWDGDSNGQLDREEFESIQTQVGVPWEVCDSDQNDQISREELLRVFLRRQQRERCRITLEFQANSRPTWSLLDTNHDQRLTLREYKQASSKLAAALADRASLTASDIPQMQLLRVGRGVQELAARSGNDDTTSATELGSEDVAKPKWFDAMDRNRDGEIDTSEFLGAREQFQRLDADNDSYLQPSEVSDATGTLDPSN